MLFALGRLALSAALGFALGAAWARQGRPRDLLLGLSAAGALAALLLILRHHLGAWLEPLLAASLLLTACLLVETELKSLMFFGLLACASVQVLALWTAQARASFAGVFVGAVGWALKRQSGRRRWLMGTGLILFAAGAVWSSRHGPVVQWARSWWRRLSAEQGTALSAVLASVPAFFGAWFLSPLSSSEAEGPALAALALCAGALFSAGEPLGPWAVAALGAMGLALGLSWRTP